MVGDSHAEDRFVGLDQMEKTHRWMLLGNRSCPPVTDLFVMLEQGGVDCSGRLPKIFHLLQKADGIEMVVLSFGYMYAQDHFETADIVASGLVPDDFKVRDLRDPPAPKRLALYRGLERTLIQLNTRGLSVVLALDIPDLTFFPADCLRGLRSCHFSRGAVLARQQSYRADMARLAETYGAKVFDPLDLFCDAESDDCAMTREGKSLYRDSHHLTLYGSRLYGQAFSAWLEKQPYPWGKPRPES